jgi:hypothetical protein
MSESHGQPQVPRTPAAAGAGPSNQDQWRRSFKGSLLKSWLKCVNVLVICPLRHNLAE